MGQMQVAVVGMMEGEGFVGSVGNFGTVQTPCQFWSFGPLNFFRHPIRKMSTNGLTSGTPVFRTGDYDSALWIPRNGTVPVEDFAIAGDLVVGGTAALPAIEVSSVGALGTTISVTAPISMGSNKISNLGAPVAPGDAVTKLYVDAIVGGGGEVGTLAQVLSTGNVALTAINMNTNAVQNVSALTAGTIAGVGASNLVVESTLDLDNNEITGALKITGATLQATTAVSTPSLGSGGAGAISVTNNLTLTGSNAILTTPKVRTSLLDNPESNIQIFANVDFGGSAMSNVGSIGLTGLTPTITNTAGTINIVGVGTSINSLGSCAINSANALGFASSVEKFKFKNNSLESFDSNPLQISDVISIRDQSDFNRILMDDENNGITVVTGAGGGTPQPITLNGSQINMPSINVNTDGVYLNNGAQIQNVPAAGSTPPQTLGYDPATNIMSYFVPPAPAEPNLLPFNATTTDAGSLTSYMAAGFLNTINPIDVSDSAAFTFNLVINTSGGTYSPAVGDTVGLIFISIPETPARTIVLTNPDSTQIVRVSLTAAPNTQLIAINQVYYVKCLTAGSFTWVDDSQNTALSQWSAFPALQAVNLSEDGGLSKNNLTNCGTLDAVIVQTNQIQALEPIVFGPNIGVTANLVMDPAVDVGSITGVDQLSFREDAVGISDLPQITGPFGGAVKAPNGINFDGTGPITNCPTLDAFLPKSGALYVNSYYVNDNVNDIQTVVDSIGASQGNVIYMGAGSYGLPVPLTITQMNNCAIVGPVVGGPSVICELANGRGMTLSGTAGRLRISSLQIEGLLSLGCAAATNNYFQSVQAIGGITVAASNSANYFFYDCEVVGTITVPSTYLGTLFFTRCNFAGATFAFSNASPLNVVMAQCVNVPTRPANVLFTSINANASLVQTENVDALVPGVSGSITTSNVASLGSALAWDEGSRTLTLKSQTNATLGSGVVISGGGGATPNLAAVLEEGNSASTDIDMDGNSIQNANNVSMNSFNLINGSENAGYVLTDVAGDTSGTWAPIPTPTLAAVLTQSNDADNQSITDVNELSANTVITNIVTSQGDVTISAPSGEVIIANNLSNRLVVGATATTSLQSIAMQGNNITDAALVGATSVETQNFTLDSVSQPGYVLTDVDGTGVGTWEPASGGGGVASVSAGTGITVTGTATDPVVNADVASITAGTNVTVTDDGNGAYTISAAAGSGSLANYYLYTADPTTQTPPPANGDVIWDNATQTSAQNIYLSHVTSDNVDVEVLFGLYVAGDTLILQDRNDSTNYQKWLIQNVTITSNVQIGLAVTFDSGAYSFPNNHPMAVIVFPSGSASGVQSVLGGTGITVDSSTPSAPVVTYSGTLAQTLANGNSAGNVGITALASISGHPTSGNDLTITAQSNNKIQLRTAGGTAALTIDNTQRTGLGTSTPTERLEVSGNVKLTDSSDRFLGNLTGNVVGNLTGNADTATTATSATTATTAAKATNVASAGAGIVFNSGADTTALSSGLGTNGQLVQTTGSGLSFVNASSLSVSSANTANSATFATTAGSADSATTATTATTATNVASAGAGVPYNSGANTTAVTSGLGTNGQVVTTTGSALDFTSQSALSVGSATTATNVAGGLAGTLVVQSGVGSTAFVTAGALNTTLMGQGTGLPPVFKTPIITASIANANFTFPGTPFTSVVPASPITLATSTTTFVPGATAGLFNVFFAPVFNTATNVLGTFRFQLQLSPVSDFSAGVIAVFSSSPFVMTAETSATAAQVIGQVQIGGLTAATNYFLRVRIVQSSNTSAMTCTSFGVFTYVFYKTAGF